MSLMCFGSPIVDIIANVDEHFLKKYDLEPDGSTKISEKTKHVFEEILEKYKPIFQAGGSVTNTVRVFNWVSKTTKTCYFGAIGTDFYGKVIKDILNKECIGYNFVEIENIPTGKCAVLVTGKNRSLVTDLGASKFLKAKNLFENGRKVISDEADFLYISALFIGVSTEVIRTVFRIFSQRKKQIFVNLGAPFLCRTNPEDVIFMFRNADVVFGNELEFQALAKLLGSINNDLDQTLLKIQEKNCVKNRLLISTSGPKPIVILENGKVIKFDVENIENIVDTNGAGDAFVGGFLAKFLENKSLDDCVKCGLWCAKNVVQNIGCKFDNKLVYHED